MDVYLKSWFGRFESVAFKRADPWLLLPTAALLVLGLLMVLNTTYFLGIERNGAPFYFFRRQLVNIAVGLLAAGIFSQLSVRGLRRIAFPLAAIALLMLLALWIPGLGVVRGGARRWLRLGPVMAEPVEVAKLALVFFFAEFLSRREERIGQLTAGPLAAFLVLCPFLLLVIKQPDFGGAVMMTLLLFTMLYAAGARSRHLASAGAGAMLALAFQAAHKSYRLRRLEAFLDPWQVARGAGFQLVQSFIALGAGGKWGAGLGSGRQKMFYLPEAHTDFVFAVIGEDFGIFGAMAVIALFGSIMFRGMRIAHDNPDSFASLLAVGLTMLISFQALINMAVVIGLVPTKGLPLPFLSYGGSAMVVSLAAIGGLLALGRQPAIR